MSVGFSQAVEERGCPGIVRLYSDRVGRAETASALWKCEQGVKAAGGVRSHGWGAWSVCTGSPGSVCRESHQDLFGPSGRSLSGIKRGEIKKTLIENFEC